MVRLLALVARTQRIVHQLTLMVETVHLTLVRIPNLKGRTKGRVRTKGRMDRVKTKVRDKVKIVFIRRVITS